MRWKVKPDPKFGDRKQVTKFAWLPTKVENHWVWLKKYVEHYEYYGYYYKGYCDSWWCLDKITLPEPQKQP